MSERKYKVLNTAQIEQKFGSFSYSNHSNGAITIERDWVEDNIVRCTLTAANKGQDKETDCHRLAKPAFEKAFARIHDMGLSGFIKTFDGLWVPRHMTWELDRPLSSHSWGIAVDINAATNPYGGRVTDEQRALAAVFVEYGFDSGVFWKTKDGMHQELVDPDAWRGVEDLRKEPELILAIKRSVSHLQYVSLQTEDFQPGVFTVNTSEISNLLRKPWPSGKVERVPIGTAITTLGWNIYDRGNHLADRDNPRYYLFVQE